MQKVVAYLYPDTSKASSLKMFQDRTNQIKGFYFTKDNVKEIADLPSSRNYAVYFLFDNSEDGEKRVYVGQSMNGIGRMDDHIRKKEFWNYCIMFVTDNNSFDKLTIDYLEYEFINKFKKSSYILTNTDLRNREPVVSIYDMASLKSFIEQIEFLLSAEGINISGEQIKDYEKKYYYPKRKTCSGKLYVRDGKFILEKGSVIKRPVESSKNWKNGNFFKRRTKLIEEYIRDEKVEVRGDKLISTVELQYDSPSRPASLLSGLSENGWKFFEGLDELRDT